jgi:glycosyltransferase involved in cell wall biosynthesis
VDDGSTDGTADVVRAFDDPRLRLIEQPNAGPSAARNRGIAASSGAWVGFLDADDSWHPEKLAAHARRARERPTAGLLYSSVIATADDGSRALATAEHEGWVLEALLADNLVCGGGSSVTVRREVLDRVGGFDATVRYGEDWELWLRIAAAYPFGAIRAPLTYRRERGDSYGTNVAAMRDACVDFLSRAFDTYAAGYRGQRRAALAGVFYGSAAELHDAGRPSAAGRDLLRTLRYAPGHVYAYYRLLRIARSTLRAGGAGNGAGRGNGRGDGPASTRAEPRATA